MMFAVVGGGGSASAYNVSDLVSAGWTKATSLDDASNNYYVFVDAGAQATAMFRNNDSDARPFYNTIVDPLTDLQEVWVIEPNGSYFTIKGNEESFFFNSGNAGWNDYVGHNNDNGNYTFTLSNEKYSIKSVTTNQWVGPWNNDGAVSTNLPENVAANKSEGQAPGFYLYAMSRSAFSEALAAARLSTLSTATKESPVDVSSYIVNADFTSKNAQGWTRTGSAGNQQWSNQTMESWHNNNVSVSQKVVGLPEGLYKVSADIIAGPDIDQTAYVFGNNGAVEKIAIATANATEGNYATMSTEVSGKTLTTDFINVSSGELTIGFKDPATGSGWVVVDNFKLKYYGFDLDELKSAYTEALVAAQDIDQDAPMLNTALAALQDALTNYSTCEETKDALTTAANALSSAVAAVNTSIEAYAKAKTAIDAANALKDAHNFASASAISTFEGAITTISNAYDARTLSNADASAAGTTLGVAVTGYRANPNGAAVNYLESGFGLTDFNEALYINTWSVEGNNDGSGFSVPFYEYWTGDANSLAEQTWTGTLTNLPNGLYSVSALVRVRAKNETAATDATGITMDVNGGGEGVYAAKDVTEGDQIGTSQFQIATYTAQNLVKNGTLTVNFNVLDGNNVSWLSFKNVKYTKVRDLTPEEAFIAATAEDYAALNAAIEAHTLGFEAGEYAPYNNVEAAKAVAAAQAIDQDAENAQEDVQAATAAITGATWSAANVAEVNAIYDGTFATAGNDGAPKGWATTHTAGLGSALHARAFVLTSGMGNYDNLEAFGQGDTRSAFYVRFDGTNSAQGTWYNYGGTDGYTMPLKANTVYRITMQAGAWGDYANKKLSVSVKDAKGTSVLSENITTTKRTSSGEGVNDGSFIFTTNEAGNYTFSLWNGNGSNNYAAIVSNIVLVKATAADLKDALLAEITTANEVNVIANVGTAAFQKPAAAATALTTAIGDAQAVYDNADATVEQVLAATENVPAAVEAYNNAELNAPDADKVYNITNVSSGYKHANKALTFKSASNADLTANTTSMGWTEDPGSMYPQGVKFTAVAGKKNVYTLSYTRADGETIYISTGKTSGLGNATTQIRPTTDATKALEVRVEAAGTEDVWYLWNTEAGKRLGANGSNDQGLFTGEANGYNFYDMKLAEAVNNEVSLSIKAANKYGTLILPFAATVPTGVTAYSVSEVSGSALTLVEAESFAANTPYIVYAETGATADLAGLGSAYTDGTYTAGLLTGVYANTSAPVGSYVLQNISDKVAFYQVETGEQPTVGANRAYLTYEAPAGDAKSRAFFFEGDDATAIATISALTSGEVEAIYTIGGARVNSLQKGINIVKMQNGETKKVIVK